MAVATNAPRIYWYPPGRSTFSVIALPRLTDLVVEDARDCADTIAVGSGAQRMDRGGWRRVTLRLDYLDPRDATQAGLIRSFLTLSTFLRAGGRVALTRDNATAWGAYAIATVDSGDTILHTGGNAFPYNPSATVSAGEELTIESPNPSHLREYTTLTSLSGNALTVPAVLQTYDTPTFIRQRDFFPVLLMPAEDARSRPFVTTEHRNHYSIDLELLELPGEIAALEQSAAQLVSASELITSGEVLGTLNNAIRTGRGVGSGGKTGATASALRVNGLFTARGGTR